MDQVDLAGTSPIAQVPLEKIGGDHLLHRSIDFQETYWEFNAVVAFSVLMGYGQRALEY